MYYVALGIVAGALAGIIQELSRILSCQAVIGNRALYTARFILHFCVLSLPRLTLFLCSSCACLFLQRGEHIDGVYLSFSI
jgi:hypothetical protein